MQARIVIPTTASGHQDARSDPHAHCGMQHPNKAPTVVATSGNGQGGKVRDDLVPGLWKINGTHINQRPNREKHETIQVHGRDIFVYQMRMMGKIQ